MDCEKEMQKAMSRFQKIAAQLEANSLDAMLITSAPNRFYAAGFASSDGTASHYAGWELFVDRLPLL